MRNIATNRILRALLFFAATPIFLQAECEHGKDSRKPTSKLPGIEVADVILSGASSVDIAELTKINQEMIGSCFDNQQSLQDHLSGLFSSAGYLSVSIEDLQIQPLNPDVAPTPVQVRANVNEGQKCPADAKTAYRFLLDHRSDSLKVDPQCVDQTFAIFNMRARFSRKRDFYIKALVDLLDFERVDEDPDFNHHFTQYPATEALHFPVSIPYLVDAIKQTDNELVRKNAVDALLGIRGSGQCKSAIVTRLSKEAEKPETTPQQKTHLQMAANYAADYTRALYGGPAPCKFENGQPATEENVLKELDKQSKKIEGSIIPDD